MYTQVRSFWNGLGREAASKQVTERLAWEKLCEWGYQRLGEAYLRLQLNREIYGVRDEAFLVSCVV